MITILFLAALIEAPPQAPEWYRRELEAAKAAAVAYYPEKARVAGIDGEAVLHCARSDHGALRNCTLVSETPAGQGFGEAALAMAARSPENPKLTPEMVRAAPNHDVTIEFKANPLAVTPYALMPTHIVQNPDRLPDSKPRPPQLAFPSVRGRAVVDCQVAIDGRLENCKTVEESPVGHDIGRTAIAVVRNIRMRPKLWDGEPVAGAHVMLPVNF